MEEKLCDYRLPGTVVYYFTRAGGTSLEGSLLEIENKNLSKITEYIPKVVIVKNLLLLCLCLEHIEPHAENLSILKRI